MLDEYYEEDFLPKLVGTAKYGDDIKINGLLYAGFLRSPYPHARIVKIDKSEALKSSKVVGVFTFEDIKHVLKPGCHMFPHPSEGSSEWVRGVKAVWRYPIAQYKTRYQGECVAVVVCKTPYDIDDAIELVNVEFEPLPPVINVEKQ